MAVSGTTVERKVVLVADDSGDVTTPTTVMTLLSSFTDFFSLFAKPVAWTGPHEGG